MAKDAVNAGEKKARKPQAPRVLTAIVTVDENGKVTLQKASYNAQSLLSVFGALSAEGANPQILNITKS